MSTERIEFILQLYGGRPYGSKLSDKVKQNSKEALQMAAKYKNKILKWYKKHVECGDGYYVESAKVSMINGGVIVVEYNVLNYSILNYIYPYEVYVHKPNNHELNIMSLLNYIILLRFHFLK